jgi:type II secretory pathway component GspD/PulD (secretin)
MRMQTTVTKSGDAMIHDCRELSCIGCMPDHHFFTLTGQIQNEIEQHTIMRAKIIAVVILLGLGIPQMALSQTNMTNAANESPSVITSNETTAATAGNQPAAGAVSNEAVAVTASNEAVAVTASNEAVAATASNEAVAVTVSNEAVAATASNEAVAVTASNEAVAVTASNEAVAVTASNEAVAVTASNEAVAVTASNETAVATAGNQPVMTNAPTANQTTGTAATGGAPAPVAATSQPAGPASAISAIRFDDIPITTAIENLARQAGINYLLDPKVGYGQPDEKGQIKAEPTISIRWENVTAQQALMALLDNYGLQMLDDPKTKIARITVKDPTAPPPLFTRVVQLKYSSVSNMVDSVQAAFTDKRSKVLPDSRTSQLVVVATERELTAVDILLSQLDKPTREVLIETRLVEISSNPHSDKGIDWSGTLQAQNVSFGNGVLDSTRSASSILIPGKSTTVTFPGGGTVTTTPGSSESSDLTVVPQNSATSGGMTLNTASGFSPGIGFLTADGLHAVLSFLNQSSEAQVVSTPRVVTLDNEMATISVTRAFPVFNTTAGTQGSPGGSQIGYTNVGTVLEVTPRISANDYIWLKVSPRVSSYFGTATKTVAGTTYQADIFDFRSIDTQVLIPNANTLVMGGMVKDNPQTSYTKVPLLGDIPILGHAFRSESKSIDKDNLLIFITPTIVKDTDFQPTESDFLRSRPVPKKPALNLDSLWDSSTPHDWSNPDKKPRKTLFDESLVQPKSPPPANATANP